MLVDQLLKKEEGLRLKVYDDATGLPIVPGTLVRGHPTIGFGIALDTGGITPEEAEFLYQGRVLRIRASLSGEFPWFSSLCEVRQAVLISMTYEMGGAGIDGFHKMLEALSLGDFAEASRQMLSSLWATQVPARAADLARILLSGNL